MKLVSEVRVSLVAAICVLALAIISKYVINAELDFVSQYGPVWIFIAYIGTKSKKAKSRICDSSLFWSLAMIFVTVAILLIYAL